MRLGYSFQISLRKNKSRFSYQELGRAGLGLGCVIIYLEVSVCYGFTELINIFPVSPENPGTKFEIHHHVNV